MGYEAGLAQRRHAGEPGLARKRPVRQPVAAKDIGRGLRGAMRLPSRPVLGSALGAVLVWTIGAVLLWTIGAVLL
jgi:hypothetical protein